MSVTHFVEFLEVGVLAEGPLVLHPLCVCLCHLLCETVLLLGLLLRQLPVGFYLHDREGGKVREWTKTV